MGPGAGPTPSSVYHPPRLTPITDKLQCRRRIRLWAKTLRRLAKGGDSKAKSAYSAIGLTIYQSMEDMYAGKLDSAMDTGILHLNPDDSDDIDPMATTEKIIDVFAKDYVTQTIRRLLSMLKDIYNGKRKDNESTAIFANRFQGLALNYLNQCNPKSSKQESQNFAMLILENANIPAHLFSSIITKLVSKSNERGNNKEDLMLLAKVNFQQMIEDIQGVLGAYQNFKTSENPVLCNDEDDEIMQGLIRVQRNMKNTCKTNNEKDNKDRSNVHITLEDSIEALNEVKIENDTKKGNENDVLRNGTMLGKRSFSNMNSGYESYKRPEEREPRKKIHIPAGEGPKATSRCRNCKKVGHWWKDPECIFNKIRSAMEEKDVVQTPNEGVLDRI